MDYGQLLSRAWDIIWEHKFLILLGVLVALASGGNTFSTGSNLDFGGPDRDFESPRDFRDFPDLPDLPDLRRNLGVPLVAGLLIALLVAIALVIGLAVWVVATLARGGLIAGVDTIASGGMSNFGQAFNAGWERGWRLIGIGIIPAIPAFILLLAGVGAAGVLGGFARLLNTPWGIAGPGIGVVVVALICILVPISLVLGLLRTFANRACMIEDLGIWASYQRGWQILVDNLGSAIVLFLIQIVLGIVIGLLMIVPGILLALCCILWPVLLLINGAIEAYFSTLWTLAWRDWTLRRQTI